MTSPPEAGDGGDDGDGEGGGEAGDDDVDETVSISETESIGTSIVPTRSMI